MTGEGWYYAKLKSLGPNAPVEIVKVRRSRSGVDYVYRAGWHSPHFCMEFEFGFMVTDLDERDRGP